MTPAVACAVHADLTAALPPVEADPAGCAAGFVDVAARASMRWPNVGVYRTFELPRARAGAIVGREAVAARLVVGAVRSGGEQGYIGVDGESIVPQLQVAEARMRWSTVGLAAAAGLVDDVWVAGEESMWTLRAVAPALALDQGWLDRSDLGAWISITARDGVATATVSATSGEGLRLRERNNGKDVAGVIAVRPFARRGHPERLVVSVYGRDGSRGLGSVRDHRLGARVAAGGVRWGAGAEVLAAWGVAGDGARAPVGGSLFVHGQPVGPWLGYARVDTTAEVPGDAASLTLVSRVGVGVNWPPKAADPAGRLLVGWEHRQAGPNAIAVAGASALATSDALSVAVEARLGEGR